MKTYVMTIQATRVLRYTADELAVYYPGCTVDKALAAEVDNAETWTVEYFDGGSSGVTASVRIEEGDE